MAMQDTVWFSRTKGINNVVEPTSLQYDPRSGVMDLSVGMNIDIDNAGAISRRSGYRKVVEGNVHSLWSNGDDCFYVKEGNLCRLDTDFNSVVIRSGMSSGLKVSFCKPLDKVYYANGAEQGYVLENTNHVWEMGQYIGPDSIWVRQSPPVGHILEYIAGYVLVASENVLYFSEPFAHSHFVLSKNQVSFETRILMVQALETGVYVGDEDSVYFLKGQDPSQWFREHVAMSPAFPNSNIVVDGYKIADGKEGHIALWSSFDGIFAGSEDGHVECLTKHRLKLKRATQGATYTHEGKYVVTFR